MLLLLPFTQVVFRVITFTFSQVRNKEYSSQLLMKSRARVALFRDSQVRQIRGRGNSTKITISVNSSTTIKRLRLASIYKVLDRYPASLEFPLMHQVHAISIQSI